MEPLELKEIRDRLDRLEKKIDDLVAKNNNSYRTYTSSKTFSGPNKVRSPSPYDLSAGIRSRLKR